MGAGRMVLLALIFVSCGVAQAAAQGRVYLTGGWTTTWREPGWFMSFATPSPAPAAAVPSVTIGSGLWIWRDVAVEGTLAVQHTQSIPWHFNYLFGGNSDQLTKDRDLPLAGYLRFAPMRGHRVSIEPIAGGGVSWHRAASFVTADCGSGSRPTPCVPVTPPRPGDTFTTAEWMAGFGVDVAFRVSSRIAIAPGFRVSMIGRYLYLTGFDHRGPLSGGGVMPGFAVTTRYLLE
jgi:hypothetical protein